MEKILRKLIEKLYLYKIYKKLPKEGQRHYWIIVTNIFVVIITFYIGINMQSKVAIKSAQTSQKLAHYEIVDRLYEKYENALFESKEIIGPLYNSYLTDNYYNVLNLNDSILIKMGENLVNITGKYKYYFSEVNQQKTSDNNGLIMIGIKMLEIINHLPSLSASQMHNMLDSLMTSTEFFLKASPNIKKNDLVIQAMEVAVYSAVEFKTDKKTSGIDEIKKKFVLLPSLNNLLILIEEMNYAIEIKDNMKSKYKIIQFITDIYDNYKILFLLIAGLILANLFAKLIAPAKDDVLLGEITQRDEEILWLKGWILNQKDTINNYFEPIKEIEDYKEKLMKQHLDLEETRTMLNKTSNELEKIKKELEAKNNIPKNIEDADKEIKKLKNLIECKDEEIKCLKLKLF